MKKLILIFILFISFLGITFANNINLKQKVYLNIINKQVDKDYNTMLYDIYDPNYMTFRKIKKNIHNFSNEKIIYFYNKILELSKKPNIYNKNKKTIDVLNYIFTLEILNLDINKEYIYSKENWNKYINKDLGFEIIYPSKYEDGSKRDILERGNILHISSDKEYFSFVKKNMETKDNYYLASAYPYTYIIEDNIKNDNDISNFLEKTYSRYGKGCNKFEKRKINNEGLYSIKFIENKFDDDKYSCNFYDFRRGLYSEKLKKIITRHGTQDIIDFESIGQLLVIKNSLKFLD